MRLSEGAASTIAPRPVRSPGAARLVSAAGGRERDLKNGIDMTFPLPV
jgi:hypothetical protein